MPGPQMTPAARLAVALVERRGGEATYLDLHRDWWREADTGRTDPAVEARHCQNQMGRAFVVAEANGLLVADHSGGYGHATVWRTPADD